MIVQPRTQLLLHEEMCSAYLSATLNFLPSFSNSAMTQSVMHGMPAHKTEGEPQAYMDEEADENVVSVHLAKRQSIIAETISSLFWMEKLMKLVSSST